MKAREYILRVSNKVTAIQWTGTNCDDIALFMGRSTFDYHMSMNDNTLKIDIMRVPVNDYIVHNPSEGFFTHMSDQEFNEKYEPIENTNSDETC